MGRAARERRRVLPRPARPALRALGVLPREAHRGRSRLRPGGRGARGHRGAALDREAGGPGDVHARASDRRAPVRRAVGARAHLLHERHDRHPQLRPADGRRPGQLGDRLGAQLRGIRHRGRAADRLDLQRRAVRGRGGARRLRSHRPVPHPGRHRKHRAPDAGDRAPAARGRRPHAVLCGVSRRVGGGPAGRSARVERRTRACRGRARRRRAGLPRRARGGLGRACHRGDGDRRHRRVAVGGVRGAGRDAPGRARLRARRADRPRDGCGRRACTTAPTASWC